MIIKNWFLILSVFLFSYIAFTKIPLIKSLNYNQDEIDYTGNAILWSEYKFNYNQGVWSLPWAYDQPHLYHYVVGFFFNREKLIALGYNDRFNDNLQFMVKWNQECLGNFYTNQEPRCLIISKIRNITFIFYILCFIFIAHISYKIFGKLGILCSLLLFNFNHNIDYNLVTAVSDSLLLLLILISISLLLTSGSNQLVTQAIISGLALSTKINGGILLAVLNIYLFTQKSLPKFKIILLINIIPWLIFIILNPYLWQNTFNNLYNIISYRFIVNYEFASTSLQKGPKNNYIFDKIYYNSQRILSFDNPSNLSALIYLACLVLTIYTLFSLNNKLSILHQNSLMIFTTIQLITLSYITVHWGRYFIPAQVGLYLNIITLLSIYKQRFQLTI